MAERGKAIFRLLFALALLVVIPFSLVSALFLYFGFTLEVFMAILALVLTYATFFRVEIALRQTAMHEAEYQPLLEVELTEVDPELIGGSTSESEVRAYILKNEGEYPAYNLMTSVVRRGKRVEKFLPSDLRLDKEHRSMLEPKGFYPILEWSSDITKMELLVRALYRDIFDVEREVVFQKPKDHTEFWVLREPVSVRRGVLLRLVEDITSSIRLLRRPRVRWEG